MNTALVSKKTQIPGFFSYADYGHEVKNKYPLARIKSNEVDKVEEIAFAELIDEIHPRTDEVKLKVKGDLPLASEFGDVNPLWLLFHRNALKRLQYA